jgi:uncharacterized protein (TIRG00374 family)
LVGELVNVVTDMLSIYLLFMAAHHTISPEVLLAAYGLPALVGKLSLIPGGIGIVEGSMASMYHLLGVPSFTAVAVVLVYRLISFWIPLILGFPLALDLTRRARSVAASGAVPAGHSGAAGP